MKITIRTLEFDIEANLDIIIENQKVMIHWREYDDWYFCGKTLLEAMTAAQSSITKSLEVYEEINMLQHFLDKYGMTYKRRILDDQLRLFNIDAEGIVV